MLIRHASDIRSSEITEQKLYVSRREFIQALTVTAAAGSGILAGAPAAEAAAQPAPRGRKLENVRKSPLSVTDEKPNSWEQITTYNNYYEFGADKDSPAIYAHTLKTEPWKVVVEGQC